MPRRRGARRQSRCTKCHSPQTPKEGPAWKDVAARYLGQPGPIVKAGDPDRINNLVNWILSLR
jgi:cytochrome c551/c552